MKLLLEINIKGTSDQEIPKLGYDEMVNSPNYEDKIKIFTLETKKQIVEHFRKWYGFDITDIEIKPTFSEK